MIAQFADNATETLFETGTYRGWGAGLCRTAVRKLDQLNQARKAEDMSTPPANHLHPLKGDRKGQWAVRINDKYRLCFRFAGENAVEVEITDYH